MLLRLPRVSLVQNRKSPRSEQLQNFKSRTTHLQLGIRQVLKVPVWTGSKLHLYCYIGPHDGRNRVESKMELSFGGPDLVQAVQLVQPVGDGLAVVAQRQLKGIVDKLVLLLAVAGSLSLQKGKSLSMSK